MAATLEILKLVISPSGIGIIVCFTALCFLAAYMTSPKVGNFFDSRKFKLGSGERHVEIGPAQNERSNTGSDNSPELVKPTETEEKEEQTDMSATELVETDPLVAASEIDLQMQMFVAGIRERNVEKIEQAYQEWKTRDRRKATDETIETFRVKMRMNAGVPAGEGELKELESENQDWIEPSLALVKHYKTLERYDLAKKHARVVINRAKNQGAKAFAICQMADVMVHTDTVEEAVRWLQDKIAVEKSKDSKVEMLEKLADLHENSSEKSKAAKALERATQIDPGNEARRFRLAYIYQDTGRYLLALHHYHILSEQDPRYPSAMNNLGVLYEKLELPGKQIKAYNRAASWGEARPVGNLANILISRGFYEEARRRLEETPPELRGDAQISGAFSRLDSHPERENQELAKYMDASKLHHSLILQAIDAEQHSGLFEMPNEGLCGAWRSELGETLFIEVPKMDGVFSSDFIGKLTEPNTASGVSGLLGVREQGDTEYGVSLYRDGLVLNGTAVKEKKKRAATLLGDFGLDTRKFFLVVVGENEIRGVMWADGIKNTRKIAFRRT